MTIESTTRGPYRTGIRRRAQIVAAASAIFARRGYAGASLRLIGDAVGMTPAGLLRHFDSKEDLLIAVLDDWVRQTANLRPTPAPQGLEYFLTFSGLMDYHMANPGLIELFLTLCTEASDPAHPARAWVAARYERIVEEGVQHLSEARRRSEVREMTENEIHLEVRGLFAMMDGLELQWIADPSLDLQGMFDYMFRGTLLRWGSTAAHGVATQ